MGKETTVMLFLDQQTMPVHGNPRIASQICCSPNSKSKPDNVFLRPAVACVKRRNLDPRRKENHHARTPATTSHR